MFHDFSSLANLPYEINTSTVQQWWKDQAVCERTGTLLKAYTQYTLFCLCSFGGESGTETQKH